MAPDGNGGIYNALVTSSVMTDMRKRGIQHVHAYCVDNCLVRVADPVFVGFAASKDADIATKVVRKRSANEPVGLIVLKDGRPDVVEYSEIDKDTAEAKDDTHADLLKFRTANIVNHYYSYRFLESIPSWAHLLPHHIARKKIPHVDLGTGEKVKPEKPNGIKLEQFVFDVFPRLELDRFACLEVRREDEFSPLKNAKGTGEDDPDTSRADILQQGRRFVEAAGATVESETADKIGVEVSPLISYVSSLLFLFVLLLSFFPFLLSPSHSSTPMSGNGRLTPPVGHRPAKTWSSSKVVRSRRLRSSNERSNVNTVFHLPDPCDPGGSFVL